MRKNNRKHRKTWPFVTAAAVLILAGGICGFRILWLFTAFRLSPTLLTLCVCYPLSWVVTDVAVYLYFRHSPIMTRAIRVIDSGYDHRTS